MGGTENIAGKARCYGRALLEPALPIRFVDCRLAPDSWAETNFYGYWAQGKDKLHDGKISLNFDEDFGNLKVYYGVFDYTKTKDKQNRVVSSGIHFIYNGQSHGLLPSEFISKIC